MAEEKKYEVDFRELKALVSFGDVVKHYSIELDKVSDVESRGACPLPDCNGKRSFTVNFQKNVFKCHSCGCGGDVLDFVQYKNIITLKQAGQYIVDNIKIVPVFLEDKIATPQSNEETEDLMDWREAAIASTKLEIALLEQLLEMKHVLLKQLLRGN